MYAKRSLNRPLCSLFCSCHFLPRRPTKNGSNTSKEHGGLPCRMAKQERSNTNVQREIMA